jgi:rhomboid protease GluP
LPEHVPETPPPDEGPTEPPPAYWRIAPVCTALIAAIAAVHVALELTGSSESQWTLVRWGANLKLATVHGEPWRLLASVFLHGGWLHLVVNGYALYSLGRLVEQLLGAGRFFVVFMIAGLAGSVASAFTGEVYRMSVGASGAIFGLLGAALVALLRWRKALMPAWRKQVMINLLVVLGLNLYIGYKLTMIDNAAHVGGLIGGAAATLLLIGGHPAVASRGTRRLVQVLGALLLAATAATVALVAITVPSRTLSRLPTRVVERAGVSVRVPRHWQQERDELVLQDPLVRLLLVEIDVDMPERPLAPEAYLRARAVLEIESLRHEKEVREVRPLPSPTLRLGAPGVVQADFELQLLNHTYRRVVLAKPQGELYVLARVLIPPQRMADYQEVIRSVTATMSYRR